MALPTKASASVDGEIILGGDLTGTADSPQLVKSGVAAGTYEMVKRITIDSKGRTTAIGAWTQAEIDAEVDAAYASSPSSFTIVGGRPVLNIPTATSGVAGLVQLGANLGTTPGVLSLPIATGSSLGSVQVGDGLSVSSGIVDIDPTDLLQLSTGGTITGSYQQSNISTSFIVDGSNNYAPMVARDFKFYEFARNVTKIDDTVNAGSDTFPSGAVAASSGSTIVHYCRGEVGTFWSRKTTDGASWETKIQSPPTPFSILRGMAYNGSIYVMYGSGSPTTNLHTAYSSDGLTWTYSAGVSFTGSMYSGIVYGNGIFLVVGADGASKIKYATSTDGVTWTSGVGTLTVPTTWNAAASLAFDGTAFVFSFANSAGPTSTAARYVYSSTNGTTWVDRSSQFPTPVLFGTLATDGAGTFVLPVGTGTTPSTTNFYYSTNNGVTWTNGGTAASAGACYLLFWTGNKFFGYTNGGRSISSTNGQGSWTTISTSALGPAGCPFPLSSSIYFAPEGVGPRPSGGIWGYMSTPYVNEFGVISSDNGSTWTAKRTLPHEIRISLPETVGTFPSSTASVGQVMTYYLKPTGMAFDWVFSSDGISVKTNAPVQTDGENFIVITCVYIDSSTWLVFKD